MSEPTDERAEEAFRHAFAERAGKADVHELNVSNRRQRRAGLIAGLAAAAAVVAVVVPVVVLRGDGGNEPSGTAASDPSPGMRWASYRGIEVQVPEDWPFAYGPSRPDCIEPNNGVLQADEVPMSPYVEVNPRDRLMRAIGCSPDPAVRGPEAFGELPVVLWQPHVHFADAASEGPPDGVWEHQGWTLTVDSVDGVRISVLVGPDGDASLADQVLGSMRRVDVDANGCQTTSPVQAVELVRPEASIPEEAEVHSIAVCQYERTGAEGPGLVGSRSIDGPEAKTLVQAIRAAPTGSGPESPGDCAPHMFGDEALSVRFLDADHAVVGEAYVYYDWCFGNGIFAAEDEFSLTAGNCRPLFATAPMQLWSAASEVFRVCHPNGDRSG